MQSNSMCSSGALDGFIVFDSRAINDRRKLFLDKREHVEQRFEIDSIIYFMKNSRTYQTGWRISFCQNLDLNRRTDKMSNLDKVSRYSNYNHRTLTSH